MRILLTALLLALACLLPARSARADEKGPQNAIVVVGSGEFSAKPDMAQIQVGVVTMAPSAANALAANNAAMEKLFKALADRGVAEKDLQTSNFNVAPQYRHDPQGRQQPEIAGYQVSNQVSVKVRQLGNLGAVLDELVTKGANQVHGVSFGVAEPEGLLDVARRRAVEDARRKAELYAKAAGVKVGRVVRIDEQGTRVPPRVESFGMARAAAVPVAPGEQQFHASVTVTFELQ